MSDKKGFITLTVVFEAMSLNRDEGMGNIQTLHLLTRGNGKTYSYMSRQALTYAVRKFLIESGVWPETPVFEAGEGKNKVTQYFPYIPFYPEPDLFGYMVTLGEGTSEEESQGKSILRPAPVTFTHALSLEPYNSDMSFYANIEMSRRSDSNPNPYNKQEHKSLYKYSIVIDLERIGIEENVEEDNGYLIIQTKEDVLIDTLKKAGWESEIQEKKKIAFKNKSEEIIVEKSKDSKKGTQFKVYITREISNKSKKERIKQLLDAILSLSHQISASREPLYPLFIAAAHLKYGSPVFHNYVELKDMENENNNKAIIDGEVFEKGIEHAKNIFINERLIYGIVKGAGDLHIDIDPIPKDIKDNPGDVIKAVKKWVEDIYK